MKSKMIIKKMKKNFKKNLSSFKHYCEKLTDENGSNTITK